MYGVREYSNLIFFASIPITPSFKVSVSNLYSQHQGRIFPFLHTFTGGYFLQSFLRMATLAGVR